MLSASACDPHPLMKMKNMCNSDEGTKRASIPGAGLLYIFMDRNCSEKSHGSNI
jgi:hypothetical protein